MRICYLTYDIDPKHGEGRYANDLINAVRKSDYEAVILKEKDDNFDGVPILKSGFRLFTAAFKARKYLKNCDIIHALDGYPYGIIAALANLGLKKRLIITILGTHAIAPLYSMNNILLKWAYKRADSIISISRYTKSELLKKFALKTEVIIINPGIDFKKFYKIPLASGENFILSVGALKYRKGYHISIPAFALAKKKIPDLKYKIVGSQKDIDYFKYLKDLASKNGIADDVEFLTGLNDGALSDLYRRAKLFVLASINENHHFEGFGLVFLEAAAAGLPVIGTLGNGIEDAVRNNYNGVLVPQKNIEATAIAITRTMKNRSLREKLSINSFAWAKDRDWDKVVLKYLKVYEKSLKKNKKVIVTTSWDDGDVLDVKLAALLDKYGVKGTFYISPNYKNRLSDNEIVAISNKHEIGAHTMSHPLLTEIPAEEAEKQIADSKSYLEKIIGKQVKMFAYPAGDYNVSVINIVKSCGFIGARTTKDWSWILSENAFEMPTSLHVYPHPLRPGVTSVRARLRPLFHNLPGIIRYRLRPVAVFSWRNLALAMFDRAYTEGGVFHIWGHSWEIDKYKMWEDLENVLKHISSREGVEFKTNGEII